ncbi:Vegetative incompatibility protein HET-E-1 [Ananas comosus]|uniref:Vegetative incompatibility protein HET-E-1 n=1 Tax=Ananas comosus TaxID=4615 RepID=A0A199VQ96_ANACO|nr:Vegetative incompatibility protein HET-E-1 [Ananas comosus]
MGLTPPCTIPCELNTKQHVEEAQSESHHRLERRLSESLSLPSLPSLNPSPPPPPPLRHHLVATLRAHSSYVSSLAPLSTSLYSGSSDGSIVLWEWDPLSSSGPTTTTTSSVAAAAKSPVKALLVVGDLVFSAHHDHKIRVWRRGRRRHALLAVLPTARDRALSLLLPANYVRVRRHKSRTWVHHVDAVSALAASRDGARLYSASWDRALKAWRARGSFRCVASVARAHDDAINAVAVSPDGHIYTASADAKIKVWRELPGRPTTLALVATLDRHRSAVNALALSDDGSVLYSGACDRCVVVWEGFGADKAPTGALRGHAGPILCLAAAGDLLCSGSADQTVRVWRRAAEEKGCRYSCLAVLEGHVGGIKSLAVAGESASGNCTAAAAANSSYLVYSGGMDGDIKVWKIFVPLPKEEPCLEEEGQTDKINPNIQNVGPVVKQLSVTS